MKSKVLPIRYKQREFSFTLVETILAIGLLAPVILYVAAVQGNSVYFVEYGQKSSQASWLAKRLMSQVEYYSKIKDLKELSADLKKQEFQELNEPFTYDLSIQPFKLPLSKMIANQLTGGSSDEEGSSVQEVNPQAKMFEDQFKSYIGDDLFKIAKVTVFWPEGAQRNFTSLSLIIYDQKKIDIVSQTLQSTNPNTIGSSSNGSAGGVPINTSGAGAGSEPFVPNTTGR